MITNGTITKSTDAGPASLPDLYVANDFGRSNLYRNRGDGTFSSVATEAGVEDPGAGMSAAWLDFANDGNQDIYVANMWSAAGMRVSGQKNFHEKDPENIREAYRHHAHGNSLYRNQGNGKFENVASAAGVEMGRWAWSSDAWDFDHDGYSDIYIANGYISGADTQDLSSFFWRQVVAKSPQNATPALNYERGWNAINELIRSDSSWSGRERNILYANNRRRNLLRNLGNRRSGFSRRQPGFCACRPRPRRPPGSNTEEPERSTTSRLAQCHGESGPLHRIPAARDEK